MPCRGGQHQRADGNAIGSLATGDLQSCRGRRSAVRDSDPDGKKTSMEWSLIGKESVGGKDGYWIEWDISGMAMGNITAKDWWLWATR